MTTAPNVRCPERNFRSYVVEGSCIFVFVFTDERELKGAGKKRCAHDALLRTQKPRVHTTPTDVVEAQRIRFRPFARPPSHSGTDCQCA